MRNERDRARASLRRQAMLAHNHGGRAIDAALRSLLLLGAVMFYGIGKLLTIADAKYQAQCVQERKAAA